MVWSLTLGKIAISMHSLQNFFLTKFDSLLIRLKTNRRFGKFKSLMSQCNRLIMLYKYYLDNEFPSFWATLGETAPGNFPLTNVG